MASPTFPSAELAKAEFILENSKKTFSNNDSLTCPPNNCWKAGSQVGNMSPHLP